MELIILFGGSSGIGHSIYQFLSQGRVPLKKELIVVGRNVASLPAAKGVIKYERDLSELAPWTEFLSLIDSNRVSCVKIILNAATIEPLGKVGNISTNDIINAVSINQTAYMQFITEIVSYIKEYDIKLSFLNITSGAAKKPISGWSVYCATKCAMRMFLDVLSLESSKDIKVVHFDPGVVDTEMQELIRKQPITEVPMVDQFIGFKEDSMLKKPSVTAIEIIEILEKL